MLKLISVEANPTIDRILKNELVRIQLRSMMGGMRLTDCPVSHIIIENFGQPCSRSAEREEALTCDEPRVIRDKKRYEISYVLWLPIPPQQGSRVELRKAML